MPAKVSQFHVRATTVSLSTPPMMGSGLAMIAIVSAIRLPFISSPTDCRWMYDGSWIRIRKGWSVPSLTTYVAY